MLEENLEDYVLPTPTAKTEEIVAPQLLAGHGKPPPPQQLILLYSADDWEEFLLEWAYYQKEQYKLVIRLGGANDFGVDVACFTSNKWFLGEWDNYQCKHYKNSLTPKTALAEIGKLLWHVFSKNLTKPRKYYFFAPKDCGPSLIKLLLDKKKLKSELLNKWDEWCAKSITSTKEVKLEGDFADFVEGFDFSIFEYKPSLQVIEEHAHTPYHSYRFFKTLDGRPMPKKPPIEYAGNETRYIAQLFEAYSDHLGIAVEDFDATQDQMISRHFLRQRENFYYAEALKLFSRDSVPPGTFEILQNEMLSGVIDIAEETHDDGYRRVKAVTTYAQTLTFPSNLLHQVMQVQDKHGICHQLANDNKLCWVPNDD
ncbi:MAG: hypothetical protein COA69_08650 [Robiginitomaculum sp.]|nr:MAG: hypothetical protein COA69_08650 [Robiginitomaculum sp.]